jgi:hypothetical protein
MGAPCARRARALPIHAHAARCGLEAVDFEGDRADELVHEVLFGYGLARKGDGIVEAWLAADKRPDVSWLHEEYRLQTRPGADRL